MRAIAWMLPFLLAVPLTAQTPASPAPDPWESLTFLEGKWDAKASGPAGTAVNGTYTFKTELNGHLLARHSTTAAGCKGPASFDCEHGDLLYVFRDAPGQPLKAIYFDNEGHVIHYGVSTPSPTSVEFLSENAGPGPQFRLVYERKGSSLAGKFQMRPPGKTEWTSYLEWSGEQQK